MAEDDGLRSLRAALVVIGAGLVVGVYPLSILWPSGWVWEHGGHYYMHMLFGLYATLGVFLVLASRHPLENLSLIRLTVWAGVVQGVIMLIHALTNPAERGHLVGDVPAAFLIAIVLTTLTPRGGRAGGSPARE
jgi:hypothetical protein